MALAVAVALGLLGATAFRPAAGCAVLAAAVPLTVGLGRDTLVPGLRVSEVITVAVLAGALLHQLARGAPRGYDGLDLAVLAYALGVVLVPALVLVGDRLPAGLDTWRTVGGPLQFLVIYLVVSRARLSARELRLVLHLALGVSVLIAAVGVAQAVDAPGVRAFLALHYPTAARVTGICGAVRCRPTSLLGHWSSYGAYSVLMYATALGLAAARRTGIGGRWLAVVMIANAVGAVASETQAAVVGLVVVTLAVLATLRRVPAQLAVAVATLAVATALLWPVVGPRFVDQVSSRGSASTPESLVVREDYWTRLFLPALDGHMLVGTGTVVPSTVPDRLVDYVDNEYLGTGFRAGAIGLALLLLMLGAVLHSGWRARGGPDPLHRALAAACVAQVVALALMGMTAEYLSYGGVGQTFWVTVGLLVATRPPGAVRAGRQRLQAAAVAP